MKTLKLVVIATAAALPALAAYSASGPSLAELSAQERGAVIAELSTQERGTDIA